MVQVERSIGRGICEVADYLKLIRRHARGIGGQISGDRNVLHTQFIRTNQLGCRYDQICCLSLFEGNLSLSCGGVDNGLKISGQQAVSLGRAKEPL